MRYPTRNAARVGVRARALDRQSLVACLASLLAAALLLAMAPNARAATEIQRVVSPGGIEAWLVEDYTVPVIALEAAFEGGAALDPAGKAGLATFAAATLDEGAGPYDSRAFAERLEDLNVSLSFSAGRDRFGVSLKSLSQTRDEAFGLLRLALTGPRFDTEPVERIRRQLLIGARARQQDPGDRAAAAFFARAFPGHPYATPTEGTLETIPSITREDLQAFAATRLARGGLRIAVAGAISAEDLGPLLDSTFGDLPAGEPASAVPDASVAASGVTVERMEVPQSSILFGLPGIARDDPDFIPAYVMNYVLGGGGFASRLTQQVRVERGLAYSVYSYLAPLDHGPLWIGGAGTQNARVAETLDVVRAELARMRDGGVTEQELADAKTYLTGAYPLRFDTNSKIAGQLLSIQVEGLGIDYPERRNALIEAVTRDDIARVARRLLDPDRLLVVVAGAPEGIGEAAPAPAAPVVSQ